MNRSPSIKIAWLLALVLCLSGAGLWWYRSVQREAEQARDRHQIDELMAEHLDVPDPPFEVAATLVEAPFAVVLWFRMGEAGRILLQERQGQWAIDVCGGHGLDQVETLVAAGMPVDAAKRLSQRLQDTENGLGPERQPALHRMNHPVPAPSS